MRAKLPFFQTTILANYIQTGVVVFSLPRLLAEHIGTNGWAALFICSAVAAVNLFLISLVYRFGKGKSIFDLTRSVLPKFIVIPLFIILAALWAVLGSLVGKDFILIITSLSFRSLHPIYLYVMLEFLVFMLLSKGIFTISNTAAITFFILIWNTLLLVYAQNDFELSRMTSFWFKGVDHTVKGWFQIYSAFLGYELCLLLFPYVDEKSHLMRAFQIANLSTTFFYALVCFVAFGFFSLHQLQHLKFPVLNLLSYVELPFVKRVDDLVFNITILRVLISNVMFAWAASETIKWVLPAAKFRSVPYVFLVFFAAIVFFAIPSTLEKTEPWLYRFSIAEVGVAFALPILLMIILLINKRRGQNYA
ncbi:GerAB/ArcD/ProY family transporter [Paenibacillus sp. CGMCC 1.16610]|nr:MULTISPECIES: GerAB/ArcD/ProY family transporter [Paenibacillus]MBA2942058.1 GerAB/ArcD/ProY family transporter [Paenibacillus sp. CGMCC 1.16610]